MKFFIKVKTKAREERVEKIDEHHFLVFVREPPEKGKANNAVARLIGDYVGVAVSHVNIVKGKTSKEKIIEVM